jgi:hypothetical protein
MLAYITSPYKAFPLVTWSARQPFDDFIVDVPSVDDTVDPDLVVNNFEDHAIIPHTQLPITLRARGRRGSWLFNVKSSGGLLYPHEAPRSQLN